MNLLMDDKGDVRVPLTFVTNALNRNVDKANQIAGWIGTPVSGIKNILRNSDNDGDIKEVFREDSPLLTVLLYCMR